MEDGAQKKIGDFLWEVPVCCREGHDDCSHIPQKQRRKKRNIGL